MRREGLRDALAGALQRLVRWHGARGEHETAIPYARRWLSLDLLHEPAHRALMELYARSGQHSAALRQYGECQRVLKEELDAEPAPETVELYDAIRRPTGLSGLEHPPGLSDLTGLPSPVRVPAPVPKHNLPTWLTPFVGREDLLGEIGQRLSDPDCHLLTLVGPGGSGKTRLAVEAAREQVARFADGVYWVSLAPLRSTDTMVSALAQAIGLSFYREGDPWQQVLDYLRRRHMLLVLDNLEHLLDTADPPGRGAVDLVNGILEAARNVKIVITSRVTPNVQSEYLLPISGMDYPVPTPSLPSEQAAAPRLSREGSLTMQSVQRGAALSGDGAPGASGA